MTKSICTVAGWALLALTIGCTSKSANPLSPTVAGPIAGVDITAPVVMQPKDNLTLAVDQQPLTLTLQNASTTGARPLTYSFEVATDQGFTNKIFTRDAVSPGDGGRTSLRLPDPLASGRSYYWRARALDGANTGPYSGLGLFTIFTPIVIGTPAIVEPVGNTVVSTNRPSFTFTNASRSGPLGTISYVIEVADSDSFANKLVVWTLSEQAGAQTTYSSPSGFTLGMQLFWHVRAVDPNNAGPWSPTAVFQTPAPPPPPLPPVVVPPSSGGTNGGSGSTDWQACSSQVKPGSTDQYNTVVCVHRIVNPTGPVSDMEVVKRVAWLLRGEGGGLLIKNSGDNVVSWQGYNFSASRICMPSSGANPYIWKIISDAGDGGANAASWQDNGTVAASGSSCIPSGALGVP